VRKEEKMKNRLMVFVFVAALLVSFSAYAAEMKKSGFLSDYSGMKPGPKGGAAWVYFKEGVDFAKYKKLMTMYGNA